MPGDDVVQGGAVVAVVGALCICGHKAWGGGLRRSKNAGFLGWHLFIIMIGAEANRLYHAKTPLRWTKSISKVWGGGGALHGVTQLVSELET